MQLKLPEQAPGPIIDPMIQIHLDQESLVIPAPAAP